MAAAVRFIVRVGVVLVLLRSSWALGQTPGLLTPPPPRTTTAATGGMVLTPIQPKPPASTPAIAPPVAATPPAAAPPAVAPRAVEPTYTADSRAAPTSSNLKVTKGAGILPNEHGQVWREYDIAPYTSRAAGAAKPEQAIIDWILRETGTEVWFSEPLGILSATPSTLRVYHTPEMHDTIRGIVERFVAGDGQPHALSVCLMTVGSPNWRAQAISLLKPVDVKSPGVEAWLLSRENATRLREQLKARGDFREHSAPQAEIPNGHKQTLARTQPRKYTRGVQLKREYPFYDLIPGQIDEGYSLELSPLLSLDGQTIETAVSCHVDQVEKLVPLAIDLPIGGQTQRVQIQVPQLVSWRLAERFRWPAGEVLLLSCGVVATPAPGSGGPLAFLNPLASGTRADALLLIEHKP